MMNLTSYLKLLSKIDYPNQTESLSSVSKAVDYTLNNLLEDLITEVGKEKSNEFVNKTFSSLGATYSPGIKIDISDRVGEIGSYIYLIINGYDFAEGDEEYKEVWIHYTWGNNQLIHDGTGLTLDELYDEVDLGTMGEYSDLIDDIQYAYDEIGLGEIGEWDELMDSIQDDVKYEVYKQTEFMIHFDAQQ